MLTFVKGIFNRKQEGSSLIFPPDSRFGEVSSVPSNSDPDVVIPKVPAIKLQELQQQHTQILAWVNLLALYLRVQLQEADDHQSDAETSQPATEDFTKPALLQEALDAHHKRSNSRLAIQPPIHVIGSSDSVLPIQRDVHLESSQCGETGEFDDWYARFRDHLNVVCDVVLAEHRCHRVQDPVRRLLLHTS